MYASGALAIVFAAILWSMDGLIRQGLYSVPSMLVVTIEHMLGALIFSPFIITGWRHVRTMRTRQWLLLIGICAVSGMLALFLYTKALASVGFLPLSIVVLLQKLQPFFTILTAAIFLREQLSSRFVHAAIVACIGGYLTTFGLHVPVWSHDGSTILAALMAVGAAACWGSSTVFSKYLLQNLPSSVATGLRLCITTVIAGIFALALGQFEAALSLQPMQWGALLLIACSAGGVALGVYYWGLRRQPASHAAIYELTWPISALAIDFVVHGVALSLSQLIGAVVLIGSMLSLPRRKL